ncbi:MAG: s23 ribosomal protein [Parcubacteria group bacterium Gr01-1014_66]|nr:MAG: s23 ribosomal protein [Parcubacteria group bacterium Gr01-1014_66]
MQIRSFQDLVVWQKGMTLAKQIYQMTQTFPISERFGLASQMRRAAVAIPSNIAEGFSRKHRKEYRHFLLIAFGSGTELETQLLLTRDLNFLKKDEFITLSSILDEIQRMLNKMITTLNKS